MKRLLPILILFLTQNTTDAQNADPRYWKNKLPYEGYWQQDVHYNIKANVDETTSIISGEEQLEYTNNSPDTLHFVYFNLYQNAFQPGSYLDDLQRNNDVHPTYGKYEKQRLGIVLQRDSSRQDSLSYLLDNTVLKVFLKEPLYPNQSTTFFLKFKTYFDNGNTRRRMKKFKAYGYTHFNGCQWYPKMCVYDRKSGWNTDQHLNREFYGDYGTFDVALTFASNYVVEATGVLQNESEVLPDTLKQKLQIRNFKNKKWESKPDTIILYKKGVTKTWKYHAEQVHDFAFTADPTYRIADTVVNGIHCGAICQEPHCSKWQNASSYLSKIIQTFSRDFGRYEYPKIVVADAQDGMEYPMLTLDGGKDPDYRGLLVHEVAHNWFYGMLGNNETYRAMMDEGFTQFLTAWGMEHIDGKYIVTDTVKNNYVRQFMEKTNVRDARVFTGYLQDAMVYNDEPINTHSDQFNGALGQGGGYRHVYYKTAAMLYGLQYVLGDSLFSAAMKHYVAQWKFCHPYPEDFRNSVIQFTHVDLNWFFDEWMETTKNIDYSIGRIKKRNKNQYQITLKRKGRMQMPIDLRVVSKKDSVCDFYIPNTWFEKNTTATVLPKWYGWDKLKPSYTATITIPDGIKNVIIDPSERMADINMLNNRKRGNTTFRFDSHIYPPMDWKKYRLYMRPDLWWNSFDGLKFGVHLEGNYMNVKHVFSLTTWFNSHLGQTGVADDIRPKAGWFSYLFSYSTAIDKVIRKGTFFFQSRWLDGCEMYKVGISKIFPHNFSANINFKAMTRNRNAWVNYLQYPAEWDALWDDGHKFNTSLNLSARYDYTHEKAAGFIKVNLRSSAVFSSFNYHYIELEHINKASVWRLDFRTRVYGRMGTGNNLPSESSLYFAGANGEEMMDNKYVRARGIIPDSWVGNYGETTNHFQYGGGLNMRGYAGYLLAETDKNGNVVAAYKGRSGAALNAEIDFERIVKVKSAKLKEYFGINTYLFGDMGAISFTNSGGNQELSALRFDAGAGVALTIKKFWFLQNIKPLTLRFDVPFYLSNAPFADPANFKFRWVVGINRAF